MNFPDWLIRNVFSSGIFWVIEVLVMGGMVLLKKRIPNFASYVMYAVGAGACIAVIFISFASLTWISSQPVPVTPLNVEDEIRDWIGKSQLNIRDVSADFPSSIFALSATLPNGQRIVIGSYKNDPNIISLDAVIVFSEDQKEMLGRLKKPQYKHLSDQLILVLASSQNQYSIELPQRITITSIMTVQNMTQDSFIQRFTLVQHSVTAAITVLQGTLVEEYGSGVIR